MSDKKASYCFGEQGEFIVKNYNLSKPFSGFFPGVAGLNGKPIWAFYVNRGQGICSMGTTSKDGAIIEYNPANKAYIETPIHGFRTLLRVYKDGVVHYYEPFNEANNYSRESSMSIGAADLFIEEKNYTLGLEVSVRCFCVPGEPFGAFARKLIIKNTSNSGILIEAVDGLPYIVPFGLTDRISKDMSNTIQAWVQVLGVEKRLPQYKLKVVVDDKPVVTYVKSANYYLSYYFKPDGKPDLLQVIVDPSVVFGPTMDLRMPYKLFSNDQFHVPSRQTTEGIMPSAMSYSKFELNGQGQKEIYSFVGNAGEEMIEDNAKKLLNANYFSTKMEESRACVRELQENMLTESSSYTFNLYCKNTFVDNVLRGGYPITLKDGENPSILHVYSRKHGDAERDYNWYHLQPTYYSQGDGNFRDVCQNRRNDVWFNPDVADENIRTFLNLIQLDGYNPLVIKCDTFIVRKVPQNLSILKDFIKRPFTIGELLQYVEKNKIITGISNAELVKLVVSSAEKNTEADFREGYWVDHWTYIADLFESYKSVFPDKYKKLFASVGYTFYDSAAVVVPRKQKTIIREGKVRQAGAVVVDKKKDALIRSRTEEPHKARTRYGLGKVYKTSVAGKLLCLVANKYSSLDPYGVGVEMEADRPGWYDALNGLPGLFGSSTCETFELKRMVLLLNEGLEQTDTKNLLLPVELVSFIEGLVSGTNRKELYREKTKYGVSGQERKIRIEVVKKWLAKILNVLNRAVDKANDSKTGLYTTYFANEITSLKPFRQKQRALPHFLEGQVHALRLLPGAKKAKEIYNAVRKNGLYDDKTKMYKVNASLQTETPEIGRVKVFSPGWLENESIWVHMEYKYLLELLRNDMYEEFFSDFKNVLIPFQNPEVFGRSTLESCSFVVSGAHPDSALHGTGFLPRLTGATAEVIHMWIWMCIGKRPFFVNKKGELNLKFEPILPDWMFTDEGTFGFNLLGGIKVVYHNPQKKHTYGAKAAKAFQIMFDAVTLQGDTVPAPYAEEIRQRKIRRIDVYLG